MTARYRLLEHPSDLGIEAEGASLAEVFATAAEALTDIIADVSQSGESVCRKVTVRASDYEQLLVRWLSEVLWLYDGGGFIASSFDIDRILPTELSATLRGELFDSRKHTGRLDVKAVTYHQVSVRKTDDGARVRVYLDI